MRLEGYQQSILSGGVGRLWHKLTLEGQETIPDSAPTITILSPAGATLVDAASMTQDGLSSWYYYDVNASSTDNYGSALDYRADIDFLVGTVAHEDRFFFDVCKWPIGDPLLTSEEVDDMRPTWAASRPVDWGVDWITAIKMAHREFIDDLRGLKGSDGEYIRPFMILSRSKLYLAAIKYTLAFIAEGIGLHEELLIEYNNQKHNAIDAMGPIRIDYDDDLLVDASEEDITVGGVDFRR